MKKTFKKVLYLGIMSIILYAPKVLAITCYTDEGKDNLIMSTGEKDIIVDGAIPGVTSTIITIIKIAVPVILVVLGTIDLAKGIVADKEDEMKKGQKLFVKRLIAGVLVFFVFTITQMIIGYFGDDKDGNMMTCAKCFINGLDECGQVEKTPEPTGDGTDETSETPEPTATLTYNSNGHCEAPKPVTMTYSKAMGVTSPMKCEGYTFVKWCINSDGTGQCYIPSGVSVIPAAPRSGMTRIVKYPNTDPFDITLYAIWEVHTYKVKLRYDTSGGIDGYDKTITVTYDSTENNKVKTSMPSKDGKSRFTGYYTKDGIKVYNADGTYNELATDYWRNGGKWHYDNDLELYGHWE